MEEILASIRQSLAEEQQSDRPQSADAFPTSAFPRGNGFPPAAPPPVTRSAPTLDRLSDVLKANAAQPTSIFGSKRPTTFDDDLADILDEPSGSSRSGPFSPKSGASGSADMPGLVAPREAAPVAGPPPPMPVPPGFPSGLAPLPPFITKSPAKEPAASPKRPQPSALSRQGGFYPPQGFAAPAPSPAGLPETKNEGAAQGSKPENPNGVLKRLADLGAVVPAPNAPASTSSAGEPALSGDKDAFAIDEDALSRDKNSLPFGTQDTHRANGSAVGMPAQPTATLPAAPLEAPTTSFAGALPIVAEPSLGEPVPAPPSEPPLMVDEVLSFATADDVLEIGGGHNQTFNGALNGHDPVVAPANYERATATATAYSSAAVTEALDALARAEPTLAPSSTAMNALDALAQGLAASAMAHPAPSTPAASRREDIPLSVGVLVPHVALSSQSPSHADGFDSRQPVRTLEDAVTDLLKPMLQQWLSDNMPRIIERALRVEAASKLGSGGKPRV